RPAEQRVLAAAAHGARGEPGESEDYKQRRAERERIDEADRDPPERNAEAVQRAVAVVLRVRLRRLVRRQLQLDGGVVRGACGVRLRALEAHDLRRDRGDLAL